MKTTIIKFVNHPEDNGTLTKEIEVAGCLIAQNGSPTGRRPEILIHLPRTFTGDVNHSFVNFEGSTYHVIGTTIKAESMDSNKPTPWGRYCIAEKIY